ncbi:MAG TPA: hypothetical protein VFP84_03140 [Kofleriaceae bacterium]|nr:hypothetical protein [Kofleriaceae bacterium]
MHELIEALARAGFDVVHSFDAARAALTPGLAALAPVGDRRLGVLVGNTRALWPIFSAARAADPALAGDPDPLDRYTERVIDQVVGHALGAAPSGTIFYGHRRYAGAFLPLQHLAAATGLAALAANHLVIHPIFGPWFALRAAVLLPGDPPPAAPPIAQPCQCTAACPAALAHAHAAMTLPAWLAVRDACTLRAHRYSDDQIAFHYHRPHLLRALEP